MWIIRWKWECILCFILIKTSIFTPKRSFIWTVAVFFEVPHYGENAEKLSKKSGTKGKNFQDKVFRVFHLTLKQAKSKPKPSIGWWDKGCDTLTTPTAIFVEAEAPNSQPPHTKTQRIICLTCLFNVSYIFYCFGRVSMFLFVCGKFIWLCTWW